jgi:hypothetical protein
MIRKLIVGGILVVTAFHGISAQVTVTQDQRELILIESTPIGALPPIALPMPASRNHNYWGFRLQTGRREGPGDEGIPAFAGGLDFQYRGGSTIGITGGYQKRDCGLTGPTCGGHPLFGIRSRINVLTGGQFLGSFFNDPSSTTTLGGEIGLGYAPNVLNSADACTIDLGMPVTLSLGQRVRIASFLTPGVVWDMSCSDSESPSRPNFLTGLGVGFQQVGNRGFDIYIGVQKIFRRESGYQVGVSFTFVRIP